MTATATDPSSSAHPATLQKLYSVFHNYTPLILTIVLVSALIAALGIYAIVFVIIRRLRRTSLEFDSVGAELTRQAHMQLDSEMGPLSLGSIHPKVSRSSFYFTGMDAHISNPLGLGSPSLGSQPDREFQSQPQRYTRPYSNGVSSSYTSGFESPTLASVPYAGPGALALSADVLISLPHQERDHVSRFFATGNHAPSPPPDYARALLSVPFIPPPSTRSSSLCQDSYSYTSSSDDSITTASPSPSSDCSSSFSSNSDTSPPAPAYTHFSTSSLNGSSSQGAPGRVLAQTSASGPLDEDALEAFLERARLEGAANGNRDGDRLSRGREGASCDYSSGMGLGFGRGCYENGGYGVEVPRRAKSRSPSATRY